VSLSRTATIVSLIIGASMVVVPFAFNLPSKTGGADNVTGAFRSTFAEKSIAQAQTDIKVVDATAEELQTKLLPGLARTLKLSNTRFAAFVEHSFPDIAAGVALLPKSVPYFDGVVNTLAAQRENFQKSDHIPTSYLPVKTVPWLLIIPGLLVLLASGLALRNGGAWAGLAPLASLAVGLIVVIVLVTASISGKTTALQKFTVAFRPVFTDQGAKTTVSYLDTTTKMARQFQDEAVPAIAKQLGLSQAQMGAALQRDYPAVAAGVPKLTGEILPRFSGIAAKIAPNIDNEKKTDAIPLSAWSARMTFWLFLAVALGLILAGGIPLLAGRRAGVAATRVGSRAGAGIGA
jgi:hypothetical protein